MTCPPTPSPCPTALRLSMTAYSWQCTARVLGVIPESDGRRRTMANDATGFRSCDPRPANGSGALALMPLHYPLSHD
eukprot:CAMPEP_0174310660 /NCGR_PEP_ID=MMETSP0810-20121108/3187_1 /TAXON_ID=73025 ORGANISM="Eutreptiella gymnastica-like, Strain CCMP1594" /NCGR_SAMPLE_ID=MMETSP0810 /ASSEMBLY_ACC=CAM_ASM_000659 /LENGTH=76 /DNA_ID=CAMNT_0015418625 /DNA_START=276 /DNA_END=503 /DNA_ORIENTATION=+